MAVEMAIAVAMCAKLPQHGILPQNRQMYGNDSFFIYSDIIFLNHLSSFALELNKILPHTSQPALRFTATHFLKSLGSLFLVVLLAVL
jgi:hypothetical protein